MEGAHDLGRQRWSLNSPRTASDVFNASACPLHRPSPGGIMEFPARQYDFFKSFRATYFMLRRLAVSLNLYAILIHDAPQTRREELVNHRQSFVNQSRAPSGSMHSPLCNSLPPALRKPNAARDAPAPVIVLRPGVRLNAPPFKISVSPEMASGWVRAQRPARLPR